MNKIGIITQARIGSTRLPGKVLLKVNDKTLLEYHLRGLLKSNLTVVVATSTLDKEQPIIELCKKMGVPVHRGSENDVLSRFHEVWKIYGFEIIVRVTSDCPLIDGGLILEAISEYQELIHNSDKSIYYSNTIERTYARGFDFEIFTGKMLDEAFINETTPNGREHVTPYFYKNKNEEIRVIHKKQTQDHSNLRITVDEKLDFDLISTLINDFQAHQKSYTEIEKIMIENPDIKKINSSVEQKKT